MARERGRSQLAEAVKTWGGGIWLVRGLGAYVLLQFGWWAYLLSVSGGEGAKWMVLGEGTVFATILILGLVRLERSVRKERERIARERNLLLGVTHELKTPLASVQLGLDSLRRLNLEEHDKSTVLSNMQQGIHDLGNLVDDMLVATRAQRKESMQLDTFSWSLMVQDALSRIGDVQRQRIDVFQDDEASMEVTGDKALWGLATSNLVENALKYSEGRVEVHVFGQTGSAAMEVRDEGRGIPVGQRSAALEPFMRINQEGSGTGLGLHLVGQTAELHGASLEMEDLEPSGFAVRLVWPQGR